MVRLATVRPENIQTVCKMLLHAAFLTFFNTTVLETTTKRTTADYM